MDIVKRRIGRIARGAQVPVVAIADSSYCSSSGSALEATGVVARLQARAQALAAPHRIECHRPWVHALNSADCWRWSAAEDIQRILHWGSGEGRGLDRTWRAQGSGNAEGERVREKLG